MVRTKKRGKKKKSKGNGLSRFLVTTVPITLLCILIMYAIIMFLTERMGLAPYIALIIDDPFTSGEAVILFIIWMSVAIVLGMSISYSLQEKAMR